MHTFARREAGVMSAAQPAAPRQKAGCCLALKTAPTRASLAHLAQQAGVLLVGPAVAVLVLAVAAVLSVPVQRVRVIPAGTARQQGGVFSRRKAAVGSGSTRQRRRLTAGRAVEGKNGGVFSRRKAAGAQGGASRQGGQVRVPDADGVGDLVLRRLLPGIKVRLLLRQLRAARERRHGRPS